MTPQRKPDGRARLLEAAADLVAASPGQDVSLRAICDRAGVQPPTLYHFFGSKQGLLDAVVEHGFDLYVGMKEQYERGDDPLGDIRAGWDAHVDFGLTHPGFYALMYGQVVPGRRPEAQRRPTAILRGLTEDAAARGLLAVPPEQAADHVLAANVGVTLHQILGRTPDAGLSAAVREATIAAITGAPAPRGPGGPGGPAVPQEDLAADARRLATTLLGTASGLRPAEDALLRQWLADLAASHDTYSG